MLKRCIQHLPRTFIIMSKGKEFYKTNYTITIRASVSGVGYDSSQAYEDIQDRIDSMSLDEMLWKYDWELIYDELDYDLEIDDDGAPW